MLGLLLEGSTVKEITENYSEISDYADIIEINSSVCISDSQDELVSFVSSLKIPAVLVVSKEHEESQAFEMLCSLIEKAGFRYVRSSSSHLCTKLSKTFSEKNIQIIRDVPAEQTDKPQNLYKALKKASENNCIPHIVINIDSEEALVTYYSFLKNISAFGKKVISFTGSFSNSAAILYRKADSSYLCCSSPKTLKRLKTVYHAERIDGDTAIYAAVGNPENSGLSAVINPGFEPVGMNAVFIPFRTETLKAFFKIADILSISGFSITKPFNREIIPYLGRISREVTKTGSANLAVWENRYLKGMNTDYYGILNLLESDLDSGKIKNAVVFGCGVAGHSAVWALRYRHVNVTILNRTADKARKLAAETMSSWDSLENAAKYTGTADLVIQATSSTDDFAPDFKFTGKELVCDLVYNTASSAFMNGAEKAGCRIISGKACLVSQGKLQFEKLTGFYYPD
ncbi:MAG: hypothetical protein K6F82_04240 [Sphaerochaetaceae bacterium]|nr:hypothetical protein [Sphaerochaetaceae bacterium]